MVDNSSTVRIEGAVWVRTAVGWQRAHGWFPADADGPAVWEVAIAEHSDGQVQLGELEENEVGEVMVTSATWKPTRRDQLNALTAQTEFDVANARARLQANAPRGWTPRAP